MELVLWGIAIWVGYKLFRWRRTMSRSNAYYEGYVANLSLPDAVRQLAEAMAFLRANFRESGTARRIVEETFEKAVWLSDRVQQMRGAEHGPSYRTGFRAGLTRELINTGAGNGPVARSRQESPVVSQGALISEPKPKWPRITGNMPNLNQAQIVKSFNLTSGSRALLAADAPAHSPRPGEGSFRFVLALIFGKTPVFYVTVEPTASGALSLWTFDSRAVHEHVDSTRDWSDIGAFEAAALGIVREESIRELLRAPPDVKDAYAAALTDADKLNLETDIRALADRLEAKKARERRGAGE